MQKNRDRVIKLTIDNTILMNYHMNKYSYVKGEEVMFLQIQELKKSYGSGENKTEVLRGVSFGVERGEICVLLGPSGSGKSTLLNIIGGIDTCDSGYVAINGEKTAEMS